MYGFIDFYRNLYKRKNFLNQIDSKHFMDGKVHLSVKDYVIWSLIVGIVFLVWMWAGNWGALPRPTLRLSRSTSSRRKLLYI
jgi:hypothetical protein